MLDNPATVRALIFFSIIGTLIALEFLIPKRRLSRRQRWLSNFGMFLVDSLLTRVLLLAGGLAAASFAATHNFGLFNWLALPNWGAVIATVIILDFTVWLQHVMSHRWNWFWRLHRVHHSDLDIDVTTALRFHPLEIFVSLIYKSAVIIALGAPLAAVFIFEIVLNGCAMFNHSNIALPRWLDRLIRPVLVTPDMHRVHHSTLEREHSHNFGFCLSLWDRLFRLYTAQPSAGHEGMEIGLLDFRAKKDQGLVPLLKQPIQ